jgi:hypothetical protein
LPVSCAGITYTGCEAFYGFDVVRIDFGSGTEDFHQSFVAAPKVAGKKFDFDAWIGFVDGLYNLFDVRGPTIGKVVAIHHRYDYILEFHQAGTLRHLSWFFRVKPAIWVAGLHIAEPASTGAGISENHEGRCVGIPALRDIRTLRFFANGVQFTVAQVALDIEVGFPRWNWGFQPSGLGNMKGFLVRHGEPLKNLVN